MFSIPMNTIYHVSDVQLLSACTTCDSENGNEPFIFSLCIILVPDNHPAVCLIMLKFISVMTLLSIYARIPKTNEGLRGRPQV